MKRFIFAFIVLLEICVFTQNILAQTKYILTNSSGVTLKSVYVEPAGATAWTTNVYTSTDPLIVNGTYEFLRSTDPANCIYDIKYVDVNGNEYYSRSVNLCNSSTITLPVSMPMKQITIKNNTGLNITAFYIAPPGSTYWSINLSNRDKIYDGETFSFLQKLDNTACDYDVKIVADDGNAYILKNYNLCSGADVIFSRPDSRGSNK